MDLLGSVTLLRSEMRMGLLRGIDVELGKVGAEIEGEAWFGSGVAGRGEGEGGAYVVEFAIEVVGEGPEHAGL